MPKSTTKRQQPTYRTLTIEVEETIAARLDAMAGSCRYPDAGAVAGEVVRLYYDLLAEVERATKAHRQAQYRRVRKQGFKVAR